MRMSEEMVWEEPPRLPLEAAPRASHHALARQLRAKPGEWGRIGSYSSAESASATAYTVRHAKVTAWVPEGHYEAVARKVEGEYRVYARYVGGSDE